MSHETFYAAVKGDPKAITEIVKQYTPLVNKIVNKYSWMSPSHSREDLVQEGLLGIVKALRTFEFDQKVQPMTWIYPHVRGAVQSVARRDTRHPRHTISIEDNDLNSRLEDTVHYELTEEYKESFVKELLIAGCGSTESKRAQIICDRYGLLGNEPLRQGEVATKHRMTKQAVNSQISRFSKQVRETRPDLEVLIK